MRNFFSEAKRTRRVLALPFGLAMIFALLLLFGLQSAKSARAATPPPFTVNSTGDNNDLDFPGGKFDGSSDGRCDVSAAAGRQCTLRAAIQAANRRAGTDTIAFNIPGGGVRTISPGSRLPKITRRVTIDGYTQRGATRNTISLAKDGTNAALMIELKWTSAAQPPAGLELTGAGASNSVIRGLVINGFDHGIRMVGGTGYRIQGNFIGTDPTGTVDEGNASAGISLFASNSTIGGTLPAQRNLISGNGLGIQARGVVGTKVQGNLIGTRANGTEALRNGGGIIVGPNLNTPSRNNLIGGTASGAANTIAFNSSQGIKLESGGTGVVNTGTRILSNSIHDNTTTAGNLGLGINLNGGTQNSFSVTENDPKDPDTGPNNLQNYPVISLAQTGGFTSINGTLNSTPSTPTRTRTFIIQFFSNTSKDASDFGEGQTFLGQTQVTTDENGDASFNFGPPQPVPVGRFITATATNKATGDTSEFSEATIVKELETGGG